jgi:hypothetical protein
MMDSKTRLEAAWNHTVPDRVPIELRISDETKVLPEAERIADFIDNEADNFSGVSAVDWQFCGLEGEYTEDIFDRDEAYEWIRRTWHTQAGEFHAVTRHRIQELVKNDYHWERRYIYDLDDLRRLVEADWHPLAPDRAAYSAGVEKIGDRGLPLVGLHHPLGWLVRNATMEEVYQWLILEPDLIHRFLEKANGVVAETVKKMNDLGIGPYFTITAHEMLIPPWTGVDIFDRFVRPYDKWVNDAVHSNGGRMRAHCHGYCMEYLKTMCDMGIDSIEPLEPPPYGDVDLATAKSLVGDRMLLSGNVVSQTFDSASADEVREDVRRSIEAGAQGGGYTLRTTGGGAATGSVKNQEQLARVLGNIEVYIDAALEYGSY